MKQKVRVTLEFECETADQMVEGKWEAFTAQVLPWAKEAAVRNGFPAPSCVWAIELPTTLTLGPWDDREGDVEMTPFVAPDRRANGWNITYGDRKEHLLLLPSASGSSPDVWVYHTTGHFSSIEASTEGESLSALTYFNVVQVASPDDNTEE